MSRKRSRDNEVDVDVVVVAADTSTSDTKRSRLDVELHPLQNVEILPRIFSLCSVWDLKNIRLVGSRLWLNESLSFWREKAVLMIIPEKYKGEDYEYNPGIILKDLKRIYNDKKSLHQFRQKPFKNYQLKGFKEKYARHGEMKWVFDKLSSHMRYLAFKNYQFHFLRSFTDTIFLKMPNLVELKLESSVGFTHHDNWVYATWGWGSLNEAHKIPSYPDHQNLKQIIIDMESYSYAPVLPDWIPLDFVLNKIPNLEKLKIIKPEEENDYFCSWGDTKDSEEMSIMKAVAKVRSKDASKLRLKSLKVPESVPLTENGFTGPSDLGFPLERFTGFMEDVMHLKSFSETLKFLNIMFARKDGSEEEEDQIPDNDPGGDNEKLSLHNLTELHVDGLPSLVYKNLNKLEAPNLKTLVLDQQQVSLGLAKIGLANPTFSNVTRLKCYTSTDSSLSYLIDAEGFKRLSESMPNVIHANMPLTGDAFKELCKAWPNINTLIMPDSLDRTDFSPVDDEAITGIAPPESGGTSCTGEGRPPNITDLKQLRKIVLGFRALTDHSVYFGFLHCPRLDYLNVDFVDVSDEAESALLEKVTVLKYDDRRVR